MPLLSSFLAQFAARAVLAQLLGVCELAAPLENGTHFPLFLLCLQQAARLQDQDWLTLTFQQSRVNMLKMLPGTHTHTHTLSHTFQQSRVKIRAERLIAFAI